MGKRVRNKDPDAVDRRREAWDHRRKGLTYEEIGRAMGITRQAAWNHCMRALEDAKLTPEEVEDLRALECERLDMLFALSVQKAEKGDTQAINAAIRIMARRAAMFGLDEPSKFADTTPGAEARAMDAEERTAALRRISAVAQSLLGDGSE